MSDPKYREMLKQICLFPAKPRLLLQVCCAPCSSHVLLLLNKYFYITIFYCNDNTYPLAEFNKRKDYVYELVTKLNLDIPIIVSPYDESAFIKVIKGLETLGEKSSRCYECYKLRLTKTAIYAKQNKYDYFTTTLSISPHKVSQWINEIGEKLGNEYNVNFLYSNFKQDDGYKHSIALSKEYGLYRQEYCGCKYSLQESKNKQTLE